MILETFILALIAGYLFKGNLKNLAQTSLRGAGFIFGGLILRNIPVLFKLPFLKILLDNSKYIAPVLFLISFILLGIGVFLNISRWPMIIVLIGVFLNFLAVLTNKGYMPVSKDSLEWAGYDMARITSNQLDMNHVLITPQTNFPFLTDIFAIPRPYPFPQLLSIGDLAMCLGLFVFIVTQMRPKKISTNVKPEI